jgi:hypothetical protein
MKSTLIVDLPKVRVYFSFPTMFYSSQNADRIRNIPFWEVAQMPRKAK